MGGFYYLPIDINLPKEADILNLISSDTRLFDDIRSAIHLNKPMFANIVASGDYELVPKYTLFTIYNYDGIPAYTAPIALNIGGSSVNTHLFIFAVEAEGRKAVMSYMGV